MTENEKALIDANLRLQRRIDNARAYCHEVIGQWNHGPWEIAEKVIQFLEAPNA